MSVEVASLSREKEIYKVTIVGSIVNFVLLAFKFVAGILGHSAAMLADAVHSLSDFVTDVIVLVFVRISNKPQDKDHDYGHGKYETLATAIIGLKDAAMKLADDFRILYSGKDRESLQNKRRVPIKKPKPTPEELWQKKYLRCLRAYLNYRSLLLEWKEQYAPKTWTEEWNEKFMISLSELTVVEYYLDILLFGDRADKEVLVKEKWKEMEKIEQCEREDKGDCYKRTERCHERNAPDGR